MDRGGAAPAILNAVNEVAVHAFLEERIKFSAIWDLIKLFLDKAATYPGSNLEDILSADSKVRLEAEALIASGEYK